MQNSWTENQLRIKFLGGGLKDRCGVAIQSLFGSFFMSFSKCSRTFMRFFPFQQFLSQINFENMYRI